MDCSGIRDCYDIMYEMGENYTHGVYTIDINNEPYQVYCEQDGWMSILARLQVGNPIDYFYRDWDDYLKPFGTPGREFWFGLDNLYWLTNCRNYSLMVFAEDFNKTQETAFWDHFKIADNVSIL